MWYFSSTLCRAPAVLLMIDSLPQGQFPKRVIDGAVTMGSSYIDRLTDLPGIVPRHLFGLHRMFWFSAFDVVLEITVRNTCCVSKICFDVVRNSW